MPFEIYDESGGIQVELTGLVVKHLKTSSESESRTERRHSESLLLPGDEFYLFARAEERDGKLVLCYDHEHQIFTMTPSREIIEDRALAPIMGQLGLYFLAIVSAMAFIVSA